MSPHHLIRPFAWASVAVALSWSAALTGTAAAATAPKPKTEFRKVETWGWRAQLPSTWKSWLNEKRDPARPYEGKWGYRSPNKNFRLRVKVRVSKGKSWKERTKTTFEKLYKRMPNFALLAANSKKLNGRDLFYVLGRVRQKRNKNDHQHLIFRMLVRFPTRKLRVVATFIAADERVEDVMSIVERFGDTFELVDPKSADDAVKQELGGAPEEL
jgi:hypothetical protein